MTNKSIKTAVIGLGYLGKFHTEKFANLPTSQLVAVCDNDITRCQAFAQQYHAQAVQDYRELIGQVDAVSIVVPTSLHHAVALFFLNHGVHVLVEKPITTTLAEADELIAAAAKNNVLLQVGHLERFNNAVREIQSSLQAPRFIESLRLAPFKPRGIDVNVVLDLMIHDIDLIQSIVKADIKNIAANGASVLSSSIDIANARLEFANGCVANVTASRVSLKTERKLRIFQHDSYLSVDLANKKIAAHKKGTGEMFPGIPEIISEEHNFAQGDALKDQIAAFLDSILHGKKAVVDGMDGKRALETAIKITEIVKENNKGL